MADRLEDLPDGHLYGAINNLLSHLAMEGSISADHGFVWDTMVALKRIDGGVYLPNLAAPMPETFQDRVAPWLQACFGPLISGDREERNHRFLEEAIELVQACGCTASEAHQLVDYVYGRPVGEPAQEVGGVMVTLAALCLANSLDMHRAAETELARIWTMVEPIRAKQAAKPKYSPLPGPSAPASWVGAASGLGVAALYGLPATLLDAAWRGVSGHHPEEWGPSTARKLTCSCGDPEPAHLERDAAAPKGRIDCCKCNGTGVVRGHVDECFSALCALNGDAHSCPGEVQPCACTKSPLNGIRATMFHDEGAIAQCGHCKRYTLDRKALSDRQPTCTCGQKHGWSGAFVKPGPDAQWHGPAPSSEGPRDA